MMAGGTTRTFVANIFRIQYIYPLNDPWRRRRHHHHHHKMLFGGVVALLLLNINFSRFNARTLYVGLQVIILDVQHEDPPHIWEIYASSFTSVEQGGKTVFLHCIVAYICYMLHVVCTWEYHTDFPTQNDWIFEIQIVQYIFEQVFKELVLDEWEFANVRIFNFRKIYAIHFNLEMWWTDGEIKSECWALNVCRYLFCCAASSYDSSSSRNLSSSTCDLTLTQCRLNFYNSAMIRF